MAIKFLCPSCKKVVSVKDEYAGKKGKCPHCGNVLTVPAPTRPPTATLPPSAKPPTPPPRPVRAPRPPSRPVDLEAEAAAALRDEPPPENAPVASTTVDFNCPMCDAELHLPLDLAGKRSPCPECRRIIKVPEPVKKDPANWRQTAQNLPSAARRPEEKAPEGAWGSTRAATAVSRESLQDAGAIPEAKALLTVRQRITRYAMWSAAAIFFTVCAVLVWYKWAQAREEQAVQIALDYAESDAGKTELGRDGQAAIHRLAGEHALRSRKAGSAVAAQEQFHKSLTSLSRAAEAGRGATEHDALLQDLAVAETALGGSPEEVDAGTKLKWDDAQKEIHAALRDIRSSEAKLEGLREVAGRLAVKEQGARAIALASSLYSSPNEEKAEALGVVGLELLTADKKGLAAKALDQALSLFAVKERPALAPSVVALAMALGRELPEPPKKMKQPAENEVNSWIGTIEGHARLKQWGEARQMAAEQRFDPRKRLEALTALAYAALDDKAAGSTDVTSAIEQAKIPPKGPPPSPWLLLRLVRIGVHAGVAEDQLQSLAAVITDRDLRGRAQLAIFEGQLAQGKADDVKQLDTVEAHTVSAWLAHEEWARRNRGQTGVVKSWEPANRAFGLLGVALGSQKDERRLAASQAPGRRRFQNLFLLRPAPSEPCRYQQYAVDLFRSRRRGA
jgi:hypothetical protein